MSNIIKVKIADYKISDNPAILVSYGLGSCVGLSLYEKELKMAGLAHIMLPSGKGQVMKHHHGKYADTAIWMMLEDMEKKGCKLSNIVAKMAGGASMFTNLSKSDQQGIGERNINAIKGYLEALKIPLIGSDEGGNYGRSIEFHSESGEMKISSLRRQIKII